MPEPRYNSKYDPKVHPQQAQEFLSQGYVKTMAAQRMGIAVATFRNWELKFEEFGEAVRAGMDEADNIIQTALHMAARGFKGEDQRYYPPNVTAVIYWLKNRRPDEWRDKQEIDATVKLSGLDEEQLTERILSIINDQN